MAAASNWFRTLPLPQGVLHLRRRLDLDDPALRSCMSEAAATAQAACGTT
eukprot:CAMPEP_0115316646 /NCGR_PEP_ID=MMETSP0270-20121206/78240_1 /TAXON_ID=71861 /ORGANISM="Scrippsiella trochoidea, Strain CCMP3099" /LENGTH=49 /DNA_ID= /DNA_START= /DNA_END= /DNA_ORIENTATION=